MKWVDTSDGLIPAYAGRTTATNTPCHRRGAHPRLRGVDIHRRWPHEIGEGSSPLTRGGRRVGSARGVEHGLIPAYAGRTILLVWMFADDEAHPRLRGADHASSHFQLSPVGSSPLTRGGLLWDKKFDNGDGLIPAYAGRTRNLKTPYSISWAHPRLRGADSNWRRAMVARGGSSPLTRGGRVLRLLLGLVIRLIPAYAGRTQKGQGGYPTCGAHPRLRGADRKSYGFEIKKDGSSPLTRGGLVAVPDEKTIQGLIPAYAGRTRVSVRTLRMRRAHPRLRGADRVNTGKIPHHEGSSPLTRGGPFMHRHIPTRRGLIPAYAGRT